jgi:hypothetical protein
MTAPTEKESKLPFFRRPSTLAAIDDIAHFSDYVLFAGAGVSIDRTGFTWEDLVVRLLRMDQSSQTIPEKTARQVVAGLGPLHAASAAVELCANAIEDQPEIMGSTLVSPLYSHRAVVKGSISIAIADLWVDLMLRSHSVMILTTNYDENLSLDIQEAVALRIANEQESEAAAQGTGTGEHHWERIVEAANHEPINYLHGRIPKSAPIIDPPVISEVDYRKRREITERTLTEAFRDSNVLIVGSSLTDPPLLGALIDTKPIDHGSKRVKRYAMLSRTSIKAGDPSKDSLMRAKIYDARLQHLGIHGVYFDHYSQVGQFLSEVRIAREMPKGEYGSSRRVHKARLEDWWKGWGSQISSADGYRELQADHHDRLLQVVSHIQDTLNDADNEQIKVELWLRWDPSDTSRMLKLWASSYARFEGGDTARLFDIAPNSISTAVRAFCTGGAVYDRVDDPHRWRTYVGVPLEPLNEASIVVGAMVIASMTSSDESVFRRNNRGSHKNALIDVINVGGELTRAP